jgi:hypothetical protein
VTEVVVQLRDAEPRNPVPVEVRIRQALKALLRHYGLRAEWAPSDGRQIRYWNSNIDQTGGQKR